MAWVLAQSRPDFVNELVLDFGAVRRGEVWRLISFVFVPPALSPIWFFLFLYFTWWVGSTLETQWGTFKFNVYFWLGVVASIGAAAVGGRPVSGSWLGASDGSLLLAFATVLPDVEILVFMILPVAIKWLGILAAATMTLAFVTGDGATRLSILAAVLPYAVFFGGHWWGVLRGRRLVAKQQARRASREPSAAPALGGRTCAMCGAREADGADIRVCSCEKCGGKPRLLCLEHARHH